MKFANAYKTKKDNEFKMIDRLNHGLGQYISFAFNNPKQYPAKPLTDTSKEKQLISNMSDEAMEAMGKRIADAFNT